MKIKSKFIRSHKTTDTEVAEATLVKISLMISLSDVVFPPAVRQLNRPLMINLLGKNQT